ncbi:PspC domain-containing protein [Robiginitalea aurantiaca]|uniref:PspC domain-containing protein n=1 Tax=Robiginitalea aurantiaca TaxID=3056915 RepID=A0ABT7WCJ3_9FLAO|nr:PspC domain-containing protein [Robiginitalea aurantiaca]MDM9630649.1 PspC domain-containing protein [Robiginitalea aurantiaca]
MNKTVNINLANMLFHIDENAFQKLQRYLEAIKRSFSGTTGSDEIIADIEARIAELFYEKMENERQVITSKEVDEVIAIMGQPEDYHIDEEIFEDAPSGNRPTGPARVRKLYRDIDRKYIGGVCAGLEYYIGIDALWIRLIFLFLAIFAGGFGLIAYIILWILVPEAATTAQKLDMTGEPVNISNIERKVKEGFDEVADKVRSVDYDKVGDQVKKTGKTFFDTVGDIIMFLFKVVGKFIGILLVIIGASTLIGLFIGLFTVGIIDAVHIPGIDFISMVNSTDAPVWLVSLLMFFALGIPFFFLMYLGLRILVNNLKSIGNIAKFSLLGLWLISLISLAVLGIKQASAHAYTGSISEREVLTTGQIPDTLQIQFRDSDYGELSTATVGGLEIRYDESDNALLYSDDLRLDIQKSEDTLMSLRIRKDADGSSYQNARDRAGQIDYSYSFSGNTLTLEDHFTTAVKNKIRDQEIRLTLFIPEGTVLSFNSEAGDFMGRRTRYDKDMYRKRIVNYTWIMDSTGGLNCLNCPEDTEDESDGNGHIIIDENGIDIDVQDSRDTFRMKIDENGIKLKARENG